MDNPFEIIEARLANIENMLSSLKDQKHQEENKPIEQLLNVHDAAKFLRLTVPTIYSKVGRGELPVMKRGNRLYFSSTELTEYLKSGRKKSNAEIEKEADAYLSKNKKG